MGILDILKQYADPSATPSGNVADHYDQVAANTPASVNGNAIAAAFRSDATPPFGQLVGNLFRQSNPQQQAGLLNQLTQALGPGALSGVAGGLLGRLGGGGGVSGTAVPTITPSQASSVSPDDVTAIASHAEAHDGSVVDKVGHFYAQHPDLVKTMGAAALAMVIRNMNTPH